MSDKRLEGLRRKYDAQHQLWARSNVNKKELQERCLRLTKEIIRLKKKLRRRRA